MGIETSLVTNVGDDQPAVAASKTITVTDAALAPGDTISVTVPVPNAAPVTTLLTQGVDFTGGAGDDALAAELAPLLAAITGLLATALNNVITVTAETAGEAGNEIYITAANAAAFNLGGPSPQNLAGGLEANQPIELRLTIDDDGYFKAYQDDTLVWKVKWAEVDQGNAKTFQVQLQQLLKKAAC